MDNEERERLIEEKRQQILKELYESQQRKILAEAADVYYQKRKKATKELDEDLKKAYSSESFFGNTDSLFGNRPARKIQEEHKHQPVLSESSDEKRWCERTGDVSQWIDDAYYHVDHHHMTEAEHLFEDTILKIQDVKKHENVENASQQDQVFVKALVGFSDLLVKNGRNKAKNNRTKLHFIQLQSLALLKRAIYQCKEALMFEEDEGLRIWFATEKASANKKLKIQTEMLARSLYEALTKKTNKRFYRLEMHARNVQVNLEAVSVLQKYCIKKLLGKLLTVEDSDAEFVSDLSIDHQLEDISDLCYNTESAGESSDAESVDGKPSFSLGVSTENLAPGSPGPIRRLARLRSCPDEDAGSMQSLTGSTQNLAGSTSDLSGSVQDLTGSTLSLDQIAMDQHHVVSLKAIFLSLAETLTKLGDILLLKSQISNAEKMYFRALQLFQDVLPEGTNTTTLANALFQLGVINNKTSTFPTAISYLQRAYDMQKAIYKDQNHQSIAITLHELGNAHLGSSLKGQTIMDCVCLAIRNELHNELKKDTLPKVSIPPHEDDSAEDSDNETIVDDESDDQVNVDRSLNYFRDCVSMFKTLDLTDHSIVVQTLVKLGDCSFITGNYEESILCYEQAKELFPQHHGTEIYEAHVHTLCMMGVVNFLLRHYSQAITLYQCAHLMRQHKLRSLDQNTFEIAFMFSLWGMTCMATRNYDKAIMWSSQAYLIYNNLYGGMITKLSENKLWLVCETLYVLGLAYTMVGMYEKAIEHLTLGQSFLEQVEFSDSRQFIRILRATGDCYSAQDDHELALTFYNQAIELSGPIDLSPSKEITSQVLQNQLLSKKANTHTSMRQFSKTAEYLNKAKEIERTLQEDIESDMVSLLHQLGQIYTVVGDTNKAIECYQECLETYYKVCQTTGPEMAATCGNLASLLYYQAVRMFDEEQKQNLLRRAQELYVESVRLEYNPRVWLDYAVYLFNHNKFGEAAEHLIEVLLDPDEDQHLIYTRLEQLTLPVSLQMELAFVDEISIPMTVFAKYLSILCYKKLGLKKDVDDCLISLLKEVYKSQSGIQFSILGYALMEVNLFTEAAEVFQMSSQQPYSANSDLTKNNQIYCIVSNVYCTLSRGLRNIAETVDVTKIAVDKKKMRKRVIKENDEDVEFKKTFSQARRLEGRKQHEFSKNFSNQERKAYRSGPGGKFEMSAPKTTWGKAAPSTETNTQEGGSRVEERFAFLKEKYGNSEFLRRLREVRMLHTPGMTEKMESTQEGEKEEEIWSEVIIGKEAWDEAAEDQKESWEGTTDHIEAWETSANTVTTGMTNGWSSDASYVIPLKDEKPVEQFETWEEVSSGPNEPQTWTITIPSQEEDMHTETTKEEATDENMEVQWETWTEEHDVQPKEEHSILQKEESVPPAEYEEVYDVRTRTWIKKLKEETPKPTVARKWMKTDVFGASGIRRKTPSPTPSSEDEFEQYEEVFDETTKQWIKLKKGASRPESPVSSSGSSFEEYEEIMDEKTGKWIRVQKNKSETSKMRSRSPSPGLESDENQEFEEVFDPSTRRWIRVKKSPPVEIKTSIAHDSDRQKSEILREKNGQGLQKERTPTVDVIDRTVNQGQRTKHNKLRLGGEFFLDTVKKDLSPTFDQAQQEQPAEKFEEVYDVKTRKWVKKAIPQTKPVETNNNNKSTNQNEYYDAKLRRWVKTGPQVELNNKKNEETSYSTRRKYYY